jgi:hypothetical protein
VTLGEIKLLQIAEKSCLTVRKLTFKGKQDTASELQPNVILNSVEKVNHTASLTGFRLVPFSFFPTRRNAVGTGLNIKERLNFLICNPLKTEFLLNNI